MYSDLQKVQKYLTQNRSMRQINCLDDLFDEDADMLEQEFKINRGIPIMVDVDDALAKLARENLNQLKSMMNAHLRAN